MFTAGFIVGFICCLILYTLLVLSLGSLLDERNKAARSIGVQSMAGPNPGNGAGTK